MSLLVLAFLGGMLTIASPCILPVLPFVLTRVGLPFRSAGLPMLAGMALAFAGVATLASVGGGWAVEASVYGRAAALVILAAFALSLLVPAFAAFLARPAIALGRRMTPQGASQAGPGASLLLGVSTGLLWAPCAGPILGLILTGAALNGASAGTTALLLAYAAGAATVLGAALIGGRRLLTASRRLVGPSEWVRRGVGATALIAVAAIATGQDVALLARLDTLNANALEERLVDAAGLGWTGPNAGAEAQADDEGLVLQSGQEDALSKPATEDLVYRGDTDREFLQTVAATSALPVEGTLPSLGGAVEWINSPPLTTASLRGKVVLVNFWTFGCINCQHAIPYVRAWAEKYRDHGLVVVGVHTPEFGYEKVSANVRKAVKDLDLHYPVAIDTRWSIWRNFDNQYWPANYVADAKGRIRYHHFGEHDYANTERVIQQLLRDAGNANVPGGTVTASAETGSTFAAAGAGAAPAVADPSSPASSSLALKGSDRG